MMTSYYTSKISRILAILMLAVTATALSGAAIAEEATRLGVVNSQRLLAESTMAKNSQVLLEKEFSSRSTEIQEQAKRLQAMVVAFEKDAPILAETERAKRQQELVAADADFRTKQATFTNDLNQRKNEELGKVLENANSTIRKIAEQRKLDLIVQDVVYFNPKIDITEEVLRNMNKTK